MFGFQHWLLSEKTDLNPISAISSSTPLSFCMNRHSTLSCNSSCHSFLDIPSINCRLFSLIPWFISSCPMNHSWKVVKILTIGTYQAWVWYWQWMDFLGITSLEYLRQGWRFCWFLALIIEGFYKAILIEHGRNCVWKVLILRQLQ